MFFLRIILFFCFLLFFFHFRRLIGKKQAREKHFSYLKVYLIFCASMPRNELSTLTLGQPQWLCK